MISIATIVMMAVCVLVSIAALAVPFVILRKRSSKIETGLSGAVSYGFLGYIWQYIFCLFLIVFVGWIPIPDGIFRILAVNFLGTLCGTACTAASLFWGIYLTNQKQLSLYRSAAVGIGFALGKIALECIYPYVRSIFFSLQINAGTFQGGDNLRASIAGTTVWSLLSGTYRCLLMFVIVFTIALLMGYFYIQKRPKLAWLSVICIYEPIMLLNVILTQIFGGNSSPGYEISYIVLFSLIAAAGGTILVHWFRTGEVVANPLAIFSGRGRGKNV